MGRYSNMPTFPLRCSLEIACWLVERGLRFVPICSEGEAGTAIWKSHGDNRQALLKVGLPILCQRSDRNPSGIMFLAGGGIKPRTSLGQTDEIGSPASQDPVHVHDLNATILHLLGSTISA
jgi:hypothetical protein